MSSFFLFVGFGFAALGTVMLIRLNGELDGVKKRGRK